ncbi:MAG: S1 RNA-binding domain-containing protein [Candidatus Aenigmarchaeota archaeon]|nr:S1 RNA-binding domain-containing protein [Candidatus Aenigmarchaeota archaeon]
MTKKGSVQRGDLVIATVTKVNPYSVIVKLDEYDREGMIHISEVSRKWVKDVKKVVKIGQTLVGVVVNASSDSISLSLKRVNKYEAEEKLKEFKREKKAEKLLKLVAKNLGIKYDDAYNSLGIKLKEKFGEMFLAFQAANATDGKSELMKNGLTEKEASEIMAVAKEAMEIKELVMKKEVDIKCYKPDGVEIIKRILSDAQKKYKVEIKYISAPTYSLSLETKNAKTGERKLTEAIDEITKNLGSSGECTLKG